MAKPRKRGDAKVKKQGLGDAKVKKQQGLGPRPASMKRSRSQKRKQGEDGSRKSGFAEKQGARQENVANPVRKRRSLSPADGGERKRARSNAKEKSWKPNAKQKLNKEPAKKPLDRKARKELSEARKKRRKPHYDIEKDAVLSWEKLRVHTLGKEERKRYVSDVLTKMSGKLLEMAKSHAISRVLQSCVKHCNESEREQVFQELKPHFLDLALDTYGSHLALRMLDHAKKEKYESLLTALHGDVVRLVRHPTGSAVVERAYQLATASQKQELVSEFFSPEFRLFRNVAAGKSRLLDILSGETGYKRKSIFEHMTLSLQPVLDKEIVDHSIVHRVLAEYLSVAPKKTIQGVVEQLSGPLLIRMIHTADGAKIGIHCLRSGTAKERKKIVKAMKGQVLKVANDDHAHTVLMSIFDVVDDTELVGKIIMSELAKHLKDICLHKCGHRVILHILAPNVLRYYPAHMLKLLVCPIQHITGEGIEEADEKGANLCISKKDPVLRRTELLRKGGLGEKLTEVCVANASELLSSRVGTDVIYEVVCGGTDDVLLQVAPEGVTLVHHAIAALAAFPKDGQPEEHILEQYHSSRTIRRLLRDKRCHAKDDGSLNTFGGVLFNNALKGKLAIWAQGHSAKVVAAFRDTKDAALQTAVKRELQPIIKAKLLEPVNPGFTPEN